MIREAAQQYLKASEDWLHKYLHPLKFQGKEVEKASDEYFESGRTLRAALAEPPKGLEETADQLMIKTAWNVSNCDARAAILDALQSAVEQQREADALACLAEKVDAADTRNSSDEAYNRACEHCAQAIRKGTAQK